MGLSKQPVGEVKVPPPARVSRVFARKCLGKTVVDCKVEIEVVAHDPK